MYVHHMSEMLPLFPLSTVLFPGMRLPLHIFEERYQTLVADLLAGGITSADLPEEPGLLSYVIGAAMIIDLPERQSLLAAPDAMARLRLERSLLVRGIGILRATTTRPAPDYAHEQFSPN